MHEIVAVSQVDFLVPQLHPDQFLDKLVTPGLHDFDGGVELRVEDPQEDESFVANEMEGEAFDLLVAHRVVLE